MKNVLLFGCTAFGRVLELSEKSIADPEPTVNNGFLW